MDSRWASSSLILPKSECSIAVTQHMPGAIESCACPASRALSVTRAATRMDCCTSLSIACSRSPELLGTWTGLICQSHQTRSLISFTNIKVGRPKNALVLQLLEGKATLPACTCSCYDWFHLLGGYPQHEHPSAEWHVFTDPAVVCLILHCKKYMISFDLEPGWTWNLAT